MLPFLNLREGPRANEPIDAFAPTEGKKTEEEQAPDPVPIIKDR